MSHNHKYSGPKYITYGTAPDGRVSESALIWKRFQAVVFPRKMGHMIHPLTWLDIPCLCNQGEVVCLCTESGFW